MDPSPCDLPGARSSVPDITNPTPGQGKDCMEHFGNSAFLAGDSGLPWYRRTTELLGTGCSICNKSLELGMVLRSRPRKASERHCGV